MSTRKVKRRTLLRTLGAAGVVGLAGCGSRQESRAGDEIDPLIQQNVGTNSQIRIPPGTYEWNGTALDVRTALVGSGSLGDVVFRLRSGSMEGAVRGTLENIVVRGTNPESKSGLDLYPGGEIRGFCWPDGGGMDQDRAIYHPEGGARTTIRNTCIAGMANNGAYVDKTPVTVEDSSFINSNVANLRVGLDEESDSEAVSYVRNSLIAVTSPVRTDADSGQNPVGLRIRRTGQFVVENCWFVFTDRAPGSDGLVEIKGDDVSVEFRNCHFHNDTASEVIRDGGSDNQVTVANCTVSGTGRTSISDDSISGSLRRETVQVPLPSAVTGFSQADDAYGFDPQASPFSQ
ncbi:right-handed parallel beta-helix repeat-containing protein [Halobaculum limi]|uniref:right-handed parallel beta-helix repeat-containing protein n=1 Tax=Halobaculum limi TaxID=3031916 RepID=UPI002405F439|nr:right-handed parallel beta-helix repeat-containing protein [Halobaculum sp. YSMS11]